MAHENKKTESEIARMKEEYLRTGDVRSVAEKFGVSPAEVRKIKQTHFLNLYAPQSDKKLISLYKKCEGDYSEMAKRLGSSKAGVTRMMQMRGLAGSFPHRGIAFSCPDGELIAVYKACGGSYSKMARHFKVRLKRITIMMKSAGLFDDHPPISRGGAIDCSDQDLIAVYRECAGDYSGMARCFGVHGNRVFNAMKRRGLERKYPHVSKRKPFDCSDRELIAAYEKCGGIYTEMAESLGISLTQLELMMRLRKLLRNFPAREKPAAGEKAA